MGITVRDLLEILMDFTDIKIIMTEYDEPASRYTILYDDLKPLMEDGKPYEDEEIDEKILDLEVMFISNEIDKETGRIVTVINVFPPWEHQNIRKMNY